MTSSPTREEIEALAAWHDRRADVVPPYRETHGLHIRTSATLRALLARAEAAEAAMRGAVTAAANADAERDAARAEAARLREALEAIAERSVGPQDRYDRYGPTWTSRKTGYEYEDASTHLEFAQEVGDMARAALAGEAGCHE